MVTELIHANPKLSIIVISVIVTFLLTLVSYFVLDMEKMRDMKERQKKAQKRLKEHKNDPKKMMEIQKEMMQDSLEMMRASFKPMLITFIPMIVLIIWLRGIYAETIISKSWIWYYIVAGILSSIIFRKIFKM